MSDDDVSEVEVVLDGVRFYVEARQDGTEHEVGSTITEGLGSAMDAIKTLGSHVTDAVKAIEPDHFSIQLGFEFQAGTGHAGGNAGTQQHDGQRHREPAVGQGRRRASRPPPGK